MCGQFAKRWEWDREISLRYMGPSHRVRKWLPKARDGIEKLSEISPRYTEPSQNARQLQSKKKWVQHRRMGRSSSQIKISSLIIKQQLPNVGGGAERKHSRVLQTFTKCTSRVLQGWGQWHKRERTNQRHRKSTKALKRKISCPLPQKLPDKM